MFLFSKSISRERAHLLRSFQERANIHFKDISLLDLAFYHRSYTNEKEKGNNERLEFLGDAVLGMATASYLYEAFASKKEGDLAKIKAVVVSEPVLSEIALRLGIDECLVLGKGEELSGGRKKNAILADATEAVIGAYYLDSGFRAVEKFILQNIVPEIQKALDNKHIRDYKTILQEYYQKNCKLCPVYELVKKTGPEHNRTFWVNVHLQDDVYGPASGKNKKEAEQSAAKLAWDAIAPKNLQE